MQINTINTIAGSLARRIQDHENPSQYGFCEPAFIRLERKDTALLLVIADGEKGANVTGVLPSTPYFDALLREASALEAEADNGLRVFIHVEAVKDETDMEEIVKSGILLLGETTTLVNAWFDCIRAVPEYSGAFIGLESEL